MIKQRLKERKKWLLPVLMILTVLFGAGITLIWMNTGFVECAGFLEPDLWVPLYAGSEGLVKQGKLEDGMIVNNGDQLLLLDDQWPRWNIERILQEQGVLETKITAGEHNLALFSIHREIEETEFRRIISSDQLLFDNASLTMNELEHDMYLYQTFSAGASRELAALEQSINIDSQKIKALNNERVLWETRLKETRILAPETGVYFKVETVLSGASRGLVPSPGPGVRIESGRLLGYIISDKGMQAHIEIPQHRISRCRPGQRVLLSVEARPQWRYPPVTGFLESITKIASGGVFHATVNLEISDQTLEDLKALSCGNLTARIEIRNQPFKPGSSAESIDKRFYRFLVNLFSQSCSLSSSSSSILRTRSFRLSKSASVFSRWYWSFRSLRSLRYSGSTGSIRASMK